MPAERIADLGLERGNQSWLGPGGHFVHYFVSGGRLLNFVGWTEHDTWNREDWTDRATIERALAAFEGWHPQVRRIIAAADTCFIWALFDRDPLPRWSAGRVTLLGDACHPMYPFMAQGAAQAIEDGATLAACSRRGGDPAERCDRYEQLRLPRVTRLQQMSRANKHRYHMPDGAGAGGARRGDGGDPRALARGDAMALRLRRRRGRTGGGAKMKRSSERFLTTHTGSLPRPADLVRVMFAKEEGVPVDPAALGERIAGGGRRDRREAGGGRHRHRQ